MLIICYAKLAAWTVCGMNRERLLLHSGTPFFRQRVAIPPFSHLLILQLMRHLFTLLLLFLSLSPVAAQDSLAIKQLRLESAKLLSRMTALEARQAHEGDDQSNSQQMIYKQNRARTMAVLSTFEAIKSCNSILQQSLVNAENQRVVADISNPQSGALGFRLDEVLLQKLSAQVSANSDIKKDNKAALLSGVSTLIGTVSQLLNPTSLVVQAVQTIANLIPNQVKDAAKDPTGKVLANQLVNSMKPYLDYYSELQKESENYGTALANMKIKYSLRWSSKNRQCEVLPSTAHARQNTSKRLAADPQKIHVRLQGRVRAPGGRRCPPNGHGPRSGPIARFVGPLAAPSVGRSGA